MLKKLWPSFYLIVLLVSLVQYETASAESYSSQFNPARGLYLLNNIPQDDWYRIFCQVHSEVSDGNIDDPRVRGCHDAIKLIGDRLALMAMGFGHDVLDIEFLQSINHALFDGTDLYNYSTDNKDFVFAWQLTLMKNRFTVRFNTSAAIEAKQYAEDIYEHTGTEIYSWNFKNRDYGYVLIPMKVFLALPFFAFQLLMSKFNYSDLYAAIPFLYYFWRQIFPCADDWKTIQYLSALNFHDVYPTSVRKMSVEELAPTHVLGVNIEKDPDSYTMVIYSSPSESHRPYFKQIMRDLHKSLERTKQSDYDLMFMKFVKKIFLMHMFRDGNTRTSRLAFNMIRLSLGLEPWNSYQMPLFRYFSSEEIVKGYFDASKSSDPFTLM